VTFLYLLPSQQASHDMQKIQSKISVFDLKLLAKQYFVTTYKPWRTIFHREFRGVSSFSSSVVPSEDRRAGGHIVT